MDGMVSAIQDVNVDSEVTDDAFCRVGMDTTPAPSRDLRQSRRDADIRRRIARLARHPMRTLCRGRTTLITVKDGSTIEAPAIAAHGAEGAAAPGGRPFAPIEAPNVIFIASPAAAGRGEHCRKCRMGNEEHERHA